MEIGQLYENACAADGNSTIPAAAADDREALIQAITDRVMEMLAR